MKPPVRRSLRPSGMGTIGPLTLTHRFSGSSPAGFPVDSRSLGRGRPLVAAFVWIGNSRSARPARWSASSVTPAFGQPVETKKARYVVALSRVLRSIRRVAPAGSPSDSCDHRHVRIWATARYAARPFHSRKILGSAEKNSCRQAAILHRMKTDASVRPPATSKRGR